jgi:hypothetical protein
MRNLLTISVIASLTFISCKKERSAELNGGGGTSNTPMLSRAVISYGTDSSVTELTYDANKKLTSISTADPQQGTSSSTITRNSQGIIQQISIFDGSSSTDYKVNYNTTSKQYTSQIASHISMLPVALLKLLNIMMMELLADIWNIPRQFTPMTQMVISQRLNSIFTMMQQPNGRIIFRS